MEIEADRRAADAEHADQDAGDEILGRGGRERGVEAHDDGAVEPGGGQEAQLVALGGELEQGVLRAEEGARMRGEGERRRLAPELVGARAGGPDHGAVAAVHAVEIADRNHGADECVCIDGIDAPGPAAHHGEIIRRKSRVVHRSVGLEGLAAVMVTASLARF